MRPQIRRSFWTMFGAAWWVGGVQFSFTVTNVKAYPTKSSVPIITMLYPCNNHHGTVCAFCNIKYCNHFYIYLYSRRVVTAWHRDIPSVELASAWWSINTALTQYNISIHYDTDNKSWNYSQTILITLLQRHLRGLLSFYVFFPNIDSPTTYLELLPFYISTLLAYNTQVWLLHICIYSVSQKIPPKGSWHFSFSSQTVENF